MTYTVGGLIQAYKTAAKEAIEAGEIIEKEDFEWVKLNFNYSDMPSTMSFIKQFNLIIKTQKFEINCELIISLPLEKK